MRPPGPATNPRGLVISYPMDRTLGSTLATVGLERDGGFRRGRLESQFGMPLNDVSRLITGINAKDDWVFTVVRTKKAIDNMRTEPW